MAITIDKASIGTPIALGTSAATIAIVTNVAVAANGLIVLVAAFDSPATSVASVAGGGLTWTIDKQAIAATSTDNVAIISAPAAAGLASGTTITVTLGGGSSGSRMLGGLSLLGADLTGTRVDGVPPAKADSATATWASGSYAIAAGSCIVGGTEIDSNTTIATISSANTTKAWEVGESVGGNSVSEVYRIEAGAGSFTVAGTWSTSGAGTTIAVAYKAAASATVFTRPKIFVSREAHRRSTRW